MSGGSFSSNYSSMLYNLVPEIIHECDPNSVESDWYEFNQHRVYKHNDNYYDIETGEKIDPKSNWEFVLTDEQLDKVYDIIESIYELYGKIIALDYFLAGDTSDIDTKYYINKYKDDMIKSKNELMYAVRMYKFWKEVKRDVKRKENNPNACD